VDGASLNAGDAQASSELLIAATGREQELVERVELARRRSRHRACRVRVGRASCHLERRLMTSAARRSTITREQVVERARLLLKSECPGPWAVWCDLSHGKSCRWPESQTGRRSPVVRRPAGRAKNQHNDPGTEAGLERWAGATARARAGTLGGDPRPEGDGSNVKQNNTAHGANHPGGLSTRASHTDVLRH